jgi:hypothetical protein
MDMKIYFAQTENRETQERKEGISKNGIQGHGLFVESVGE